MSIDITLEPKKKRPTGEVCCQPVAYPKIDKGKAAQIAKTVKALADPVRVQLVDVLRHDAGKVCVCELIPLFDLSQPTISHHLKVLRDAGIVGVERQGLWAFYYVIENNLQEVQKWLR